MILRIHNKDKKNIDHICNSFPKTNSTYCACDLPDVCSLFVYKLSDYFLFLFLKSLRKKIMCAGVLVTAETLQIVLTDVCVCVCA